MIRLLYLDGGSKLCFREFADGSFPEYAILSHTWYRPAESEFKYRDVIEGTGSAKLGYKKIIFCINKAAEHGIGYCWVDTCCINKDSSAELSEAINSMYRWYHQAARCYAYLTDVSTAGMTLSSPNSRSVWEPAVRKSLWFTRGWTLQELLASSEVYFFSAEGLHLRTRSSLHDLIADITRLPTKVLQGAPLSDFSYEERISWADSRQTTKPEDRVYCLLGVLDISMPATYGEGETRARTRLKVMIDMLTSPQRSILSRRPRSDSANKEEPLRVDQPKRQEGTVLDAENRAKLLRSLRFDQIEARQLSVKKALAKTCKWLLQDPQYLKWMDDSELHDHRGFLWIKGKPGSGKSTLMKFALANAWRRYRTTDTAVLSFFFNARGDVLEKSTPGMYRTLLIQLLEQFQEIEIELGHLASMVSRISDTQNWDVETLKELFSPCLDCLGSRKVVCFVDALDECDEKEIRDMISYFEDIGEQSLSAPASIPHLTVEDTPGHTLDMDTYLSSELRIGQSPKANQIRCELLERASGVFIWIALVVEIPNKEFDSGRLQGLLQRLQEIPDNLFTLFKEILTRDASNQEVMLLCIQWILFAEHPLAPGQLYVAIPSGLEKSVARKPEPEQDSPETLRKYVLNASKGLAEITKTTSKTKVSTVQFIHESVRDFLLKEKGLEILWPELRHDVERACHSRLHKCCRPYLDVDLSAFDSRLNNLPKPSSAEAQVLRNALAESFPFLKYATSGLLFHLNKTADGSTATDTSRPLTTDTFEKWKHISNGFAKYKTQRYHPSRSLLFILCHRGHNNLARQQLIRISDRLPTEEAVSAIPEMFEAMGIAMERNNDEVVEILQKTILKMRAHGKWDCGSRIVNRILQLAIKQG